MPILSITPHSAGTALRFTYALPVTGKAYIILRKLANDFTGETDPAATVVKVGMGQSESFLDFQFLINGTLYYYKPYWTADGITWTGETVRSATPAATYVPESPDALTFLRERIDSAMQVALARGELNHPNGAIQVLTASPTEESTTFPVVTLHLTQESSDVRGLGDGVGIDFQPTETSWRETKGWLSRVQIAVVGWSLNPDEREALRRALRDAVIANLDLFDAAGLLTVDFSQQNVEDFQSYNAPIYQTIGQFSCLAPSIVGSDYGVVRAVERTLFFNAQQI